jgi:hypothetical protein
MRRMLDSSLRGIAFFGTTYICLFLEVCSGAAVLTQAVRACGLTSLEPVDILTGWDLTLGSRCRDLKAMISKYRPLHTHFAPCCRIFSQAYHPPMAPPYYQNTHDYRNGMQLAMNIANIAVYVVSLSLFVSIENPGGSSIFGLTGYQRIAQMMGFFFVKLNMCMFNLIHPATGFRCLKAIRLLTNAPWLIALGVKCSGDHGHTKLVGHYTSLSARYPKEFGDKFAKMLAKAPAMLDILHQDLPYRRVNADFYRINSMTL